MNIIGAFLVFALLCGGVLLAVPVLTVGVIFLVVCGSFLLWLLPILIIASSDETTGGEKLCWILAIVFLSWFAWILYFFVAPVKPKYRHYDYY
ncbi:MAG: hypothetical protein V4628_11985 [Pseudomonadota bacterium]